MTDVNKLIAAVSVLFEYCRMGDEKYDKLRAIYVKSLSQYDIDTAVNRIYHIINTKQDTFLPAIGLIMEPQTNTNSMMERDWYTFIKNMNNHNRSLPIPDWVYTIKKHIGWLRVEDIKEDELHWLKREYEKVYPLVKSCQIMLEKDPAENKYIEVGGIRMMLTDNILETKISPKLREAIEKKDYKHLIPDINWKKDIKQVQ